MATQDGLPVVLFFGILILWLAGITFFLYRFLTRFQLFTKGISKKDLTSVLEKLYTEQALLDKKFKELEERLGHQEKDAAFKLQKLGLLRFNPFADTGGEQSFTVSFLDQHDNGLVLSSLQGRSGTRWYVKQVKNGKGVEFDLSKEEQEAIKKAKTFS